MKITIERLATKTEIRADYKRQGCEVRISHEGHVTYRRSDEKFWREGRFVEEYKFSDEYGVRLT